jgi:hypothetical protein
MYTGFGNTNKRTTAQSMYFPITSLSNVDTHGMWNCAFFGVTRLLKYRNASTENWAE